MLKIEILWHEKVEHERRVDILFKSFCQQLANRLIQGYFRYGKADKRQRYKDRMKMELEKYEETGNAENLYNIANYCFLEILAPSHKKFHYDDKVESATRKHFGL